jgi:two-component system NtrC family response regulator
VSLAEREIDAELVRSLLGSTAATGPEALDLATLERRHIQRVLHLTAGNKTSAARLLGVDRKTLQRKGF